ncbi:MAG TPA: class I SAM-dependent methyltransferase [Acidimicrobiia bacterium]
MSWSGSVEWWLEEIESDPTYEDVITPLLVEMLQPMPGGLYLDLGCGEGRVMRAVDAAGGSTHGLDANHSLAVRAGRAFVAELPVIPIRDDVYDGVYCVLTLEHVPDHIGVFVESARVARPGGVLALVMNHPIWTAPGSTPISDQYGEVLWRPGGYFDGGFSEIPAGAATVTFHHRSMAGLLGAAAEAGWRLEQIVEQPHFPFEDQAGIPRLLACRWRQGGRTI